MRVLVACEYSGIVREAFRTRGHDAWSCDLLPTEIPGPHFECNIADVLATDEDWDLMIAFPPCTHLAVSGARWFKEKEKQQQEALEFVHFLANAFIRRIAIENPVGILSTRWRKPDQIIQPWQFGHAEIKTTCLWLKELPLLKATNVVRSVREQKCWKMPPSEHRARERARTYQGIADAMADQWGDSEDYVQPVLFEELAK